MTNSQAQYYKMFIYNAHRRIYFSQNNKVENCCTLHNIHLTNRQREIVNLRNKRKGKEKNESGISYSLYVRAFSARIEVDLRTFIWSIRRESIHTADTSKCEK